MCPSGTRLGPEHDLRYVFVLNIFCQQLRGLVQLGVFCVLFGHKVGAFTCSEIYICIGYVLPTIVGCCSFGGCTFVLDIFCQQLWSVVQLGAVCVPFGHKVGAFTCSEIYICIGYVLPTILGCCSFWGCTYSEICICIGYRMPTNWDLVPVGQLLLYWTYNANT